MRILLTGGTGLIGRALCAALTHEGHTLTVLSRKPQTVTAKCGAHVQAMQSLDEWRTDTVFDAVINLAGEPIIDLPWTDGRKKKLRESRVTLTEQLISRIEQASQKPRVLLSGSAIGYYGSCGDAIVDEHTTTHAGDFGATLCAAWEQAATKATDAGVRVCLLRTGLVLSPHGGLLARMLPSFKYGLGAQLGDGTQWMSWIHINDYVHIVLQLLGNSNAAGAYNMTAPTPVTNKHFTLTLAKLLHRPALLRAPAWFLKILLGQRAYLLVEGQRVLPARLLALGYDFTYPQLDDALRNCL